MGAWFTKAVLFLQYLSRVVSEMKAEDMANISKGLEYAFDQFDKVKYSLNTFGHGNPYINCVIDYMLFLHLKKNKIQHLIRGFISFYYMLK